MSTNENDFNDDISYYSKKGEYLEDLFTLRDFLSNPTTRKILENNHCSNIEKHIIPKIKDIYNIFKKQNKDTRILHRDTRNIFLNDLIVIINNHITKNYRLEIFYEKRAEMLSVQDFIYISKIIKKIDWYFIFKSLVIERFIS